MRNVLAGVGLGAAALVLWLSAAGAVRAATECTCCYGGQSYALEACVCLMTPGGARLACCGQVLNNTSWNFTGEACPMASLPDRRPAPPIAVRPRPAGPRLAGAMAALAGASP